ncbi:MAG: DUF1232 domain-containing protein [Polyangia bacterium]|jgi:uncharacterized membrane protein YkvA (DUF1232 family)|nr:DUF1232 domain-containing protein [Polyangia bacterium]
MSTELVDLFNEWISSLAEDAKTMRAALEAKETPKEAKRFLTGGLSYLMRKIDIVPDYLTGVGLVDDAAVLRIAAGLAASSGLGDLDVEISGKVEALGSSTKHLETYLGELFGKLEEFVKKMPDEVVRARTADKILDDKEAYQQFLRELGDEIDSYAPQTITEPDRALRELKSFFKAKLDK